MPPRPALPLAVLLALLGAFLLSQTGVGGNGLSEPTATAAAPAMVPASATVPAAPAQAARSAAPIRAARSPAPIRRPALHGLAVVRGELPLRDRPGGAVVVTAGARTEFGGRRVLSIAARRGAWLGVVASELPNGRLAWVHRRAPALELRRTAFSLHADLSARRLVLRANGRAVRGLSVAVGAPGSVTPTGRFAVTEKLSGPRYSAYYGCCVLGLSGKQTNLPAGWTGGNRLAIHGTNDPSSIGAAASAGCLRAADGDLRILMSKVLVGTPVFIRR